MMGTTDFKRAAASAGRAVKAVSAAVRRSPALALLTSLAAGFLAGLILKRSAREGEAK
jgi:hypothetical protein